MTGPLLNLHMAHTLPSDIPEFKLTKYILYLSALDLPGATPSLHLCFSHLSLLHLPGMVHLLCT